MDETGAEIGRGLQGAGRMDVGGMDEMDEKRGRRFPFTGRLKRRPPPVSRGTNDLSLFIIPFPFSPHTAASLQIASAASSPTGIPSLVLFQPPHLSPSPAPSPSLLFQHVQRLTSYLQAFYICMYIGRSLLTSGSLGSEINTPSFCDDGFSHMAMISRGLQCSNIPAASN